MCSDLLEQSHAYAAARTLTRTFCRNPTAPAWSAQCHPTRCRAAAAAVAAAAAARSEMSKTEDGNAALDSSPTFARRISAARATARWAGQAGWQELQLPQGAADRKAPSRSESKPFTHRGGNTRRDSAAWSGIEMLVLFFGPCTVLCPELTSTPARAAEAVGTARQ